MIHSQVIQLYRDGLSMGEIAKKLGTYPSKVYGILKKANEPLRSKSEAQKKNLDSGKVAHPTKGKQRSEEVKAKIGDKVYTKWQNLPEEEKIRRAQVAKENWDNMDFSQRKQMQEGSIKGIHKASKFGSKMEKVLVTALTSKGYNAIHHKKKFLSNTELEVDILIPEIKTVIEIDGPSHFDPVWGEAALARTRKADAEKNGLLLRLGYNVVRIRYSSKHVAKVHERLIMEQLIPILKSFANNSKDKYHEIEVIC